jgi:hypothetical protein
VESVNWVFGTILQANEKGENLMNDQKIDGLT